MPRHKKPFRPLTVRPVEPCICEHAKRDHEGQTGACGITGCGCEEWVAPADSSDMNDDDEG